MFFLYYFPCHVKPNTQQTMAICYGCVAIAEKGVIAEYSEDDKQNFRAVVSSMLPNIAAENTRKLFVHERYVQWLINLEDFCLILMKCLYIKKN